MDMYKMRQNRDVKEGSNIYQFSVRRGDGGHIILELDM